MLDVLSNIYTVLTDPEGLLWFLESIYFTILVMLGAGVMAILILIARLLGVNIAQYMWDSMMFLLDAVKTFFTWVTTTFHYNRPKELLALALLTFFIMVVMLMAFDLNAVEGVTGISIGSDAVRDSTESETGTEVGDGEPTGTTVTITVTTSSLATTSTLPPHCYNGFQDGDESGIDCGGSCPECHCNNRVKDGNEIGVDCGGSCGDCFCNTDGGYDVACEALGHSAYCCDIESFGGLCGLHCVTDVWVSYEHAQNGCDAGLCRGSFPTWDAPLPDGKEVIQGATIWDWH